MKKVISVFLSLVLLISLTMGISIESNASTNGHSQSEAVAWVNSQVNTTHGNGQCVYFVRDYYAYLGQTMPTGNANQYVNGGVYCPAGWSYQNAPQPGDIAVWANSSPGHVAVVTEIRGTQMVCVESNYAGRTYVSANLHSIDATKYIRPDFNNDKTPPSYDDFKVAEFTNGRFTVYAHVTDPSGIASVRYAVWSDKDGQDDIKWYAGNHTDGNGYYWIHVYFSEHNNEKGNYIIHMYMRDNAGNEKSVGTSYVFPDKAPTISNIKVSDISSKGYTVTCTVKATSEMGVWKVQFPTWTEKNGQDDLVSEWWNNSKVKGTISGNTVTFRVNASDHNNEGGKYITHIYAYDKIGNNISVEVVANVHDHNAVTDKAVPATCTKAGKTEGSHCSVCGQVIVAQKTVDAKGHKEETDRAVDATCEKTGKTEGAHCKVCGEILVAQETVKAKGHTPVTDKTVPATFKAAGKTEGSHCSTCGKVLVAQKTVAKLGAAKLSKVTAGKKQFKATWKSVKNIDGYQLQYSTDKNFKKSNKTITVKGYKSTSKMVKKLKAKKKYYVQIRAYKTINGKKQYSAWSKSKTVTTKK